MYSMPYGTLLKDSSIWCNTKLFVDIILFAEVLLKYWIQADLLIHWLFLCHESFLLFIAEAPKFGGTTNNTVEKTIDVVKREMSILRII